MPNSDCGVGPADGDRDAASRGCGVEAAMTCATAPEGVTTPVWYGRWLTAIILSPYPGRFLARKHTAQAPAELIVLD